MNVSIALGGFGSQGWGNAAWGFGNVSFVATGSVGSVTVVLNPIEVTGVVGTVSVGSVIVNASANTSVTGLQALGQLGSVTVETGNIIVDLVGVSCTASVTSVSVWITINDSQTPSWIPINDSQTGTWNDIIDVQTPNWAEIA
jgi:hypothetical protein